MFDFSEKFERTFLHAALQFLKKEDELRWQASSDFAVQFNLEVHVA